MDDLLFVDVDKQQLIHYRDNTIIAKYLISTAAKGVGENNNSWQTPRGWHKIAAKVGDGLPANAIYKGRRPTGELFEDDFETLRPNEDWILSRILWLKGLESGKNQGKGHDSLRRYIYIHGTPDTRSLGVPRSKGCINMRNASIIELFNEVAVGTKVYIYE